MTYPGDFTTLEANGHSTVEKSATTPIEGNGSLLNQYVGTIGSHGLVYPTTGVADRDTRIRHTMNIEYLDWPNSVGAVFAGVSLRLQGTLATSESYICGFRHDATVAGAGTMTEMSEQKLIISAAIQNQQMWNSATYLGEFDIPAKYQIGDDCIIEFEAQEDLDAPVGTAVLLRGRIAYPGNSNVLTEYAQVYVSSGALGNGVGGGPMLGVSGPLGVTNATVRIRFDTGQWWTG